MPILFGENFSKGHHQIGQKDLSNNAIGFIGKERIYREELSAETSSIL